MNISFDKETGLVQLQPSPKQWMDEIIALVKYNVEEI